MSENSENLSTSSVPSRPTSPLVSLMPPKPVVLVGLMGCGKTSIGKRLAKRFDLPFVDSDQEVELAAGCSVNDIDSIFGEGSLEAGEYKVISRLLSQSTQVIATGCFSFTFENTRALIKEKATSVWLNADLQTLFMRITGRKDRPLLEPGKEEEILKKMMDDHYPFFNQADVCIKTYDEPANVTVDRVIIAMSDFIKANYPDYHVLKSV